jgi:transposase
MNRIIGIDVSKDTLDAAFIEDKIVQHQVFPNAEVGFHQLLKWCRQRGRKLHFCMEATGAYSTELAEFLHVRKYPVYVENAKLIKSYRESDNERNTTDKMSAAAIANYATAKLDKLRRWEPLPEPVRVLRDMTRLREAFVASKVQWTNRRKSRSLYTTAAHADRMIEYLKSCIKSVDKDIQNHVRQTPELRNDCRLLRSIKGIGPITAAVILSEVPFIRQFKNKADLIAYAGLNPALRKSGTSINYKPMLSKKGNTRLRKALYMPAVAALKHNPRMKEFADRLSEAGKHKMSIVGAAMRRLLCFVFGVLRSGEEFWNDGHKPKPKMVA